MPYVLFCLIKKRQLTLKYQEFMIKNKLINHRNLLYKFKYCNYTKKIVKLQNVVNLSWISEGYKESYNTNELWGYKNYKFTDKL